MESSHNLISLKNIQYQYPQGESLSFKDLGIDKGAHTLLLGNSGTGKTTFLHILTGLLKPSHGEVVILGKSIYQLNPKDLDHFRGMEIGIVFQNAHLIESLTVFENVQIAQGFAGNKTDYEEIENILNRLGLREQQNKYPRQLSRGQVQRVAIARALINKPALLVADEPTASLDDHHTEIVMDLLFDQAQQSNATLIVATHDQRIKHRFEHTYLLNKTN